MGDALASLEALYVFLTTNLSAFQAAFPKDPEKSAFMSQYVQARKNYWDCIDATFHDDDPQVVALVKQIKTEQTSVEKDFKTLSDLAKTLNDITTAVDVGSKLATFAV
jgi:hypothetical protein